MSGLPRWVNENIPEELATSKAFRFKISLPAATDGTVQEFTVDLFQDIDINYENLEEQMERMPAQYAFWAGLYSDMKTMTAVFDRKVKARRGGLTQTILEESKTAGVKPTEKQILAIVEADEVLNRMEGKYAMLQAQVGKLYHMLEAVRMKSELARSLAGFKRQEKEQTR